MKWFLQKTEGMPGFLCLSDQLRRIHLAGKEENLASRDLSLEKHRQLDASHALHHDIGNEIVGRLSSCSFERHLRISKGDSIEQMHLQNYAQHLGDADLVVDYKDARMRLKRVSHLPALIMVWARYRTWDAVEIGEDDTHRLQNQWKALREYLSEASSSRNRVVDTNPCGRDRE
jgi:hypothetical protein